MSVTSLSSFTDDAEEPTGAVRALCWTKAETLVPFPFCAIATMWFGSLCRAMVGVPRSRAIADWPTGRLALDKVNVEVLMGDLTAGVELRAVVFVPAGLALTFSAMPVLLLLRVATAAPFKLFMRAEAALRGVLMRFLGRLASVDASPVPGTVLHPRSSGALIPACVVARADTAEATGVVTDVRCDAEPLLVAFTPAAEVVDGSPKGGEQPREGDVEVLSGLTSLELLSWRISGLLRRPCCCCCCSGVVVPTGAGNVFPK